MRLSLRIPLIIALVAVISIGTYAVLADQGATRILEEQSEASLEALLDTRLDQLDLLVEEAYANLAVLSASEAVGEGLPAFTDAVSSLGDPQGSLQNAYRTANPFDDRSALSDSGVLPGYDAVHADFHGFFATFVDEHEYDDLLLIAPDGRVVYSVEKRTDFGTDLTGGAWTDSVLGESFRFSDNARVEGAIGATDFGRYEPAGDVPTTYLSTPVMDDDGAYIGVLAIQFSSKIFSEVLLHPEGLGETGHTFLVGEDLILRSDDRFTEGAVLVATCDCEAVGLAVAGRTGSTTGGHDGESSLVRYEPFTPFPDSQAGDLTWAAIAELELVEIGAPERQLRNFLLLIGAGMALAASVVGVLAARSVSKPVNAMADALRRLANKEADLEIPGRGRSDEIGEMADAATVFAAMAKKSVAENEAAERKAVLSKAMQEAGELEDFGAAVLGVVSDWLDAPAGTFFVLDEDSGRYGLVATHAFDERAHLVDEVAPGQGIVGQAIKEQKPLLVRDIPEDHLRLSSTLGESRPRGLLAVPFLNRETVIGAAEFALLSESLSDEEWDTIREIVDLVGLNLENNIRSERNRVLYEESQARAEELRASEEELRLQSEELASTNEALQEQKSTLERQAQDLRATEEELRSQQEELQATNDALAERQAEVERARTVAEQRASELEQASTYKSQFLANMSHELRTPLNSMLILSEDLASNHDGNLTDEQSEAARIIHESGTGLLRLINDILDLSKVEAGRMQIDETDVQLASIVGALDRVFSTQAVEKGIDFSVTIDEDVPMVLRADPLRVEQIVVNLASNAVKFTEEGSVTVRIGVPELVPLDGADPSDYLSFTVRDTGVGIPAEHHQSVFESFRQGEGSTARRFGGTGLGLPISLELAKLMGGTIVFDSVVGSGSTFVLYLPHRTSETESPPMPIPLPTGPVPMDVPLPSRIGREEAAGGGESVLIIEDDPVFSRLMSGIARDRGLRPLVAATGSEGVALAQANGPDAILLDLGLPDMDGWEVLEALKAHEATSEIPVHVISARDDVATAEAHGADGYLMKPASRNDLGGLLDELLADAMDPILRVGTGSEGWLRIGEVLDRANVPSLELDDPDGAMAALESQAFASLVVQLDLPNDRAMDLIERASERSVPIVVVAERDLAPEEELAIRSHTDVIVHAGPKAGARVLDEVELFLHAVAEDIAPDDPAPSPEGEGPFHGERVLLVDDDMRNLFALSTALRRKGLSVLMAQDGHKAIDQLDQNPDVDIVLMDVMMPGIDGLETTRRIRADGRYDYLPIIVLTAKAMAGDREMCLSAGANDYLTKPVDMAELVSTMSTWIDREE